MTNPSLILRLIKLARPLVLLAGFIQYTLGAGIAHHLGVRISQTVFIAGAVWILFLQLAVHFLIEYYISETDSNNQSGQLFGGSEVFGNGDGLLPRKLSVFSAATMLTIVLLVTYDLLRSTSWNFDTSIVALLIFAGAMLYTVTSLQLARTGYAELTIAIVLANLVPAFGFLLQARNFHYLLAISTFPLTGLVLAMLIVFEFPDYATDIKFGKRTLLVQFGWKLGMKLHHVLVVSSFVLLGLAAYYGFPANIIWPAMLPFPLGLIQIWYLNRIAQGIKPNWSFLTFNAVALFGLTAYILSFTLWTR